MEGNMDIAQRSEMDLYDPATPLLEMKSVYGRMFYISTFIAALFKVAKIQSQQMSITDK